MWKNRIDLIEQLVEKGHSMSEIARMYGVSRQRMYQVFSKYNISTPERKRRTFMEGRGPEYYWLSKMLTIKGIKGQQRLDVLNSIKPPRCCPCLGLKLNYDGSGKISARTENSPSIDRIDSSKGYTPDNIHIISWRANRIKNDSTWEELIKISDYIKGLTEKS